MLTIVSREKWKARKPTKPPLPLVRPTPRLWLHHTANQSWHGESGMRRCQSFHMDVRKYNDIGYSFVIDNKDGRIFVGRGPGIVGAHTEGDNSKSHAICLMGDFTIDSPSTVAVEATAALIQFGHAARWWPDRLTGGHRDAPGAQTACPGNNLYRAIPRINELALGDDMLTKDEHDWLARIHHEVASGDTSGQTVTQMLQTLLSKQASIESRLAAIESKLD